MKKWTPVESALTPDGKTISLHEHDGSYAIRVDGAQLMSTRQHFSEEKLAELACAHLADKPGARVLIGGLGFSFTLRATLSLVGADATIIVAEIMAAVIRWNRNSLFRLGASAMADPRVVILQQDVLAVIRQEPNAFDSIILDVDNGPAAITTGGNDGLYDAEGLRSIRAALRPGGCVGFWSAAADPAFERRLGQARFAVTAHVCRARPNSGGRHTLYVGRADQQLVPFRDG